MENLKNVLNRIPYAMLVAGVILYLAYDWYTFETDLASPKLVKNAEIARLQDERQKLLTKVKEAEEFYRNLEAKRQELRTLATELSEMKAALSDEFDPSAFMKVILTEAKKLQLRVEDFAPTGKNQQEFYIEYEYGLKFKGLFAQLVGLMKRLSSVQTLVRVDDFEVTPSAPPTARYVELKGNIKIKAYRYAASAADQKAEELKKQQGKGG